MRSPFSLRSWLYLALLLISVGPSLASAQGIEQPRVPLKKAVDELRAFREAYADAFNKKNSMSVASMYSPDGILISDEGVLIGGDAIRKSLAAEAPNWPQMTISSDTLRVFGNTAWDIGTTRAKGPGGDERVSHYLVVLRRGYKDWKINSLAVVPERNAADSAAH
jgi:ketosteroid isomerase-like protein